jgi:hypothetical protein
VSDSDGFIDDFPGNFEHPFDNWPCFPAFTGGRGAAEVLASASGTRLGAPTHRQARPHIKQRSYGLSQRVGFNAIEAPGCGSAMNK